MSLADEFPNWFAMTAEANFARFLKPLAGNAGLRFLQIGCFVGNATAWMVDNGILDGLDSLIDDVDVWDTCSEDLADVDFTKVESAYDEAIAQAVRRRPFTWNPVLKHKISSREFLHSLPLEPLYDFVYIDGDHTAAGTLEDLIGSWQRLKVGGLLACDDYTWRGDRRPWHCPYPAIDAFANFYKDSIEVLEVNQQVWLKRTA